MRPDPLPRHPDRELSWLAFNHRVLQEAADPTVPLFDRLGFLAIFSSNLDEFFRVRVASLRASPPTEPRPAELLARLHAVVAGHQERFGQLFRGEILPALEREGIRLVDAPATAAHRAELERVFRELVAPHLRPVVLAPGSTRFVRDRAIHLVVELRPGPGAGEGSDGAPAYGLVEIPSPRVPRFFGIPSPEGGGVVIFLDDVVRLHLPDLFPGHRIGASHAVKLTRDAELYLDEDRAPTVADAVRRGLGRRETGTPSRFLFDGRAPAAMVAVLKGVLGLREEDLVVGGRYHNLHDLHSFPRFGRSDLASEPHSPVAHPDLDRAGSVLGAVAERDRVLHLPYQSFEPLLRFLDEAAADPRVEEVWATLYRVADDSRVVGALADAARRGKRVTAFVEVKARFDEAANLVWAERLAAAGARVLYSLPHLKVHAKMILVVRPTRVGPERFACLSTGNFNERTARTYTDHAILTAHPGITRDVREVFAFLAGEVADPVFRHLLVGPFSLRSGLRRLIAREARHAREGRRAAMVLKMNSLQDPEMVDALCRASGAGVRVDLLVRGICCLAAGVPGLSENVHARSIVDRFLEHARLFAFHDGGREACYLASADWMVRNLSHRVEVAFPVLDPGVKGELMDILALQLADDRKARVLDPEQSNRYLRGGTGPGTRSQVEILRLIRARSERERLPPEPVAPADTTS